MMYLFRGRGTREVQIMAVVTGSVLALFVAVQDISNPAVRLQTGTRLADLGKDPKVQAYVKTLEKTFLLNLTDSTRAKANKKVDLAVKPNDKAEKPKGKNWGESAGISNQTKVLLQKWDPKHEAKVNPHPFKFTINNPKMCEDKDVFLLIYIHTAPDHYSRRALIRATYGNYESYENYDGMKKVRLIFVMGLPTEKAAAQQDALREEASLYNDIVQESFLDTYHNLSYKGIAAMKWIKDNCRHAKFVLKADDDVFVNIFPLIKHFTDLDNAGMNKKLILCLVWWKMHVLRDGKWGIPKSVMPDDLYPPYCSGMAYMFTTDVAVKIYDVSYYVPFFWVDDAYISGMLPKKAGLTHTEFSKVYKSAKEIEPLMTSEEWYKYCFSHIHDWQRVKRMWKHISSVAKSFRIPTPTEIKPGKLADTYRPVVQVLQEYENRTGIILDIPYLRKLDKTAPKKQSKKKSL